MDGENKETLSYAIQIFYNCAIFTNRKNLSDWEKTVLPAPLSPRVREPECEARPGGTKNRLRVLSS